MQNQDPNAPDYNAPLLRELKNLTEPEPAVSPNNPPWGALVAFGAWVLSVLAIFVFPALFIVPYMIANRGSSIESFQTDSTAILLNLAAIIPAHLFTLLVAWLIATRNRRYRLAETLGFRSGGFQWWYYPLILAGFFGVAALVGYFIPEGDNDLLRMLRSSRAAVVFVVVMATFTAPLVEEMIYRGLMYSAFQRSMGMPAAVALVTFLFALVHVPQYLGSPGTILLVCLLSLVLTLIRVQSNNLLPCIVMHTIFNGIQSIGILVETFGPGANTQIEPKTGFILRLFT